MRKKILSMSIAAVLTAVTSSSVMAFDTSGTSGSDTDGPILVQSGAATDLAAYQGNLLPSTGGLANPHYPVQAISDLALSPAGRGDALIFPMFRQGDDWGTEIVVRNTSSTNAIIAKVAVYEFEKSKEVFDFNIYLSAADVVRFKIKDGVLTSTDGSVIQSASRPESGGDTATFASVNNPFSSADQLKGINRGYVVVYGMGQASTRDPVSGLSYHQKHESLFTNYRRELDACRPSWRQGHQLAMDKGAFVRTKIAGNDYNVAAPNQALNCTYSSDAAAADAAAALASVTSTAAAASVAQGVVDVDAAAAATANDDAVNANLALTAANAAANDAAVALAANPADQGLIDAKTNADAAADAAAVTAATAAAAVVAADTALATSNSALATANALATSAASAYAAINARIAAAVPGNFFGDVGEHLAGTVRLFADDSVGVRDMMLPAKAIKNFTDGNKLLWAEGEIASLQDRRIQGTDDASTPVDEEWAKYNEAGIRADATAFIVNNTNYTFAKDSLNNQLTVTQPYKRVLVQLGNDDGYWKGVSLPSDYGNFSLSYNVYNEDELTDTNTYFAVSPYTSTLDDPEKYADELVTIKYMEKDTDFDGKNGFALVKFFGKTTGVPAIVTQMVGTVVNDKLDSPQLNWIYSQTN